MSFLISHRDGTMQEGQPSMIADLLLELDGVLDDEHPDVSLTDVESGWMLSAFQRGRVVWENPDDENEGQPRYMTSVSRVEVAAIMRLVSEQRLDQVNALPWLAGYREP
jgi:hypothetical protein